jgi:hypothetical protein
MTTTRSKRTALPPKLGEIVVAIGTWLYNGKVPQQIELRARPADMAGSRWIEDSQTGEFVINEGAPIPVTADGFVYYVGATSGGEFLSVADAIAWADRQPWGPVKWNFRRRGT